MFLEEKPRYIWRHCTCGQNIKPHQMTFKHAVRCQTFRFQQDLIFSTWIEFIRPPDHTAMKCTLYMVCSISYHAGVPAMPTIPYVDCLHSSGGEISLAAGMIQLGNWLGASAPLLFWFSRTQNEKSLTPLKITSACSIKPPVSDYFTKHRRWIRFSLVLEFWVRYYDFNTFFFTKYSSYIFWRNYIGI